MVATVNNGSLEKDYELANIQATIIGQNRLLCSEPLFKAEKLGIDMTGTHQTAYNSATKIDIDIRGDLFNNIVMSRNTSMFKGNAI